MRYDEFVDRVQHRAELASRSESAKVVEAVLETLGERLGTTEREDLAAQLPEELRALVLERHETDRYPLEEFYRRVGARADVLYARAMDYARAVASVLKEAISPGELKDIRARLPAEYKKLFE